MAVLVRDLPAAIELYRTLFGARIVEQEYLPASGADIAVLEMAGLHLEFLSTRQAEGKLARLLREQGEGIHHLSFQVQDLDEALARLREVGIRLRDQVPRPGLHGRRIAFLDPQDTLGVLIELVEESATTANPEDSQ